MIVDRPLGIDLGTTNSEIALLLPSEREVLVYQDRFGRKTVPSAVAWDPKKEQWLVGRAARQRRGQEPAPIESVKRRMGRSDRVSAGPHELLPEEVSAKILAELRTSMESWLAERAQEGVTMRARRAVITVPAYFDAPQVEATRKAGELAGWEVLGILQEPTAAAIYQTWKNKLGDGHVLVYDLGGGTFDVSILRCIAGEYQVLAIDGDNFLGGDDLDRRFAEKLRKDLVLKGWALDLDVRGNPEDRARFERLVHIAQEIKESLSTAEFVDVAKQDALVDTKGESVSIELEVSRADWERATADLVETTITCCKRAIARAMEVAAVGLDQIDHVVLVGGSTRVPLVQRRVRETLCTGKAKEPLSDDVDTIVALGAAVHAAQLGGLRLEAPSGAAASFLSPLVATGDRLKLTVRAEAPAAARDIAIRSEDGRDLARAELTEAPSRTSTPLKLELPLPASDGDVPLQLAIGDAEPLAFEAYRGELRPRASTLSRPTVVPKDIGLEVVRGGRRERAVLVARGAGLPTESSHVFFTADQSGAVVLKLLQGRMPIKTLMLQVPKDLAVGTMVELRVRCDETMRLEARAKVGAHELWAAVEPSEQVRFASAGEVEALLDRAERVKRDLWGSYASAYASEADRLIAGIREVVGTDPPKLDALCAQLRTLVDEFEGDVEGRLAPPLTHFEATLNALRRVVYRTSGALLGLSRDGWEEKMKELETEGRRAWDARDPIGWRSTFNELQALHETATQEEFAQMRLDDPAYLARHMRSTIHQANDLEKALSDFVPSAAADVRALQMVERDRLHASLRDKVSRVIEEARTLEPKDPNEARRKLDLAVAEIERIEAALARVPAMGLVSERGGGGS